MKHALPLTALSTALCVALLVAGVATPSDADAASRRVVRPNAAGGTTATTAVARRSAHGASVVRGRAVATDSQGNATAVSGMSASGAGAACRAAGAPAATRPAT